MIGIIGSIALDSPADVGRKVASGIENRSKIRNGSFVLGNFREKIVFLRRKERLIMSQRAKRIIVAMTLAIFALYYANICFFYHGHIVNGVTIVHSHFYGKAHPLNDTHSESELTLISALSLFQSCAPAFLGAVLPLFLALTAIRYLPFVAAVVSPIVVHRFLRAPPAGA